MGFLLRSIVHPNLTKRVVVVPGFDPRTQPIVPMPEVLSSLQNATMQLDFICEAFNKPAPWQVEPVFTDAFQVDSVPLSGVIPAAVFFPLVQRSTGLHVIFTRRSMHLCDHAGQISFPGGRIEPTDSDAIAAALRETQEEVGIEPKYIQLIGTQPGFLTSTHFAMKPVIGWVRPGFTIRPDKTEVDEVFEVPLSFLMDPAHHQLHKANLPDGGHRLYFSMAWGSYFIWGATAALIRNFYHFLAAAQANASR